jgi:ABC-2 type transport system permease protein
MTRLVRAELLKLQTIRTFKGVVGGAVIFSLIRFAMVVVNSGKIESAPLGTGASTRDLMLTAGAGAILLLVVGVLSVSTEVRHGTIVWTLLATPQRWRVLGAKVGAVAVVALTYLIAMSALILSLIAFLFSRRGIPFDTVNGELAATMAGSVIGIPLYAILGVGLGALIHNQIAALLIPLSWVLIVETLLPSFGLIRVMAWLPGGATAALARADLPGLLPAWAGALLMVAYAAAALAAGGLALGRRDLT